MYGFETSMQTLFFNLYFEELHFLIKILCLVRNPFCDTKLFLKIKLQDIFNY